MSILVKSLVQTQPMRSSQAATGRFQSISSSAVCMIAHALALHKRCYLEAEESRRVSVK